MQPCPLRFVILRHEGIDSPHFDLMFETSPGSLLATWRSDLWPIQHPTPIYRLHDHRVDYLSYEGPVNGNRGHVSRVADGTFSAIRMDEMEWLMQLRGAMLKLTRQDAPQWLAIPASS